MHMQTQMAFLLINTNQHFQADLLVDTREFHKELFSELFLVMPT